MLEYWVLVVFVFYFAIILPEIETCVVFVAGVLVLLVIYVRIF